MPHTAKLLFDSARTGVIPGARALAGGERSLLFAAGGISVDMVVFESAGGLRIVHGQVIDTAHDGPAPRARVQLGDLGEPVDTDHFGQFAVSALGPLDATVLHVEADGFQVACTVPAAGVEEPIR